MDDRPESGSRARTRQAIVDAAVRVFGQRRGASLADVAAGAGVSRSTLHRYFADRDELVQALGDDVLTAFERVIADAEPDQGPPREALRRLVTGYAELGQRIYFLFSEPSFSRPDPDARVVAFFDRLEELGRPVGDLVERAQRDGVVAANFSVDWVMRTLLWMVFAGSEAVEESALSRLAAPATIWQTLEFGIMAPPDRP